MKVHWLYRRWHDFPLSVACGQWKLNAESPNTTENPEDVTCRSCQKVIEDDMRTIDEVADENAQRKAKQTGRGRAVSELVDRYGDEFERLWEKHTAAVLDEIRETERLYLEREKAWEAERRETKRKELLAQLEALGELDKLGIGREDGK